MFNIMFRRSELIVPLPDGENSFSFSAFGVLVGITCALESLGLGAFLMLMRGIGALRGAGEFLALDTFEDYLLSPLFYALKSQTLRLEPSFY